MPGRIEIPYLGQSLIDRLKAMLDWFERGGATSFRRHRTPIVGEGGCEPQNAIIDIILPGRPTGGTFTLTWTITSTATKTFNSNDDATAFAATLATHGGIPSSGDIDVTAGPLPNATIRVEFKGALKNRDIPLPTGNWTNLDGGSGVGIICAYAQRGHS